MKNKDIYFDKKLKKYIASVPPFMSDIEFESENIIIGEYDSLDEAHEARRLFMEMLND